MSGSPVEAYRHCERLTRRRAGNFSYGIRLLQPPRRRAMCAVYAFARRVDDVADGALDGARKLAELERARADLRALDPAHPDPVLAALADAVGRYTIPLEAFEDLIDGAEMDVRGTSYATFGELVVYCRRVAGSIGRLSLGVFGGRSELAEARADDLGVALQLTNILRDLREDLERGRVYLPAEDLERFGCRLAAGEASGDLRGLVAFETGRAERWFERGLELLPLLDRRSAACVAAMAGIYHRLLRRIERDPAAVLDGQISLPGWEKGWVAARGLLGVAA